MSSSRRASFNPSNQQSPGFAPSPLAAQMEEKAPLTASEIAQEYFSKELELHKESSGAGHTDTVVIIHDQCYGHRFSRPKTGSADLMTIVERPERLLATALGVSVAYVRLGGRHAEGQHPPHPNRDPSQDIPFRIRKTDRSVDITSAVVKNVHGTDWMDELRTMCDTAETKLAGNGKEKELGRIDGPKISKVKKPNFHPTDLYLCSESLNALQGALGGVFEGVDAVFHGTLSGTGPSRAFVTVRPPGHHCSADFPSGFCWLNNVHVGIEYAAITHGLTHAAIIDFDLHHGDGSQDITWSHNAKISKLPKNAPASKRTSIGYFSLHDINSYPCEDGDKEKVQNASLCIENAHNQTIWNIHLQPWRTQVEFWALYEARYQILIEKARVFLKQHSARIRALPKGALRPKAAIFLSAGFDASEHETEGMQRHKVNVPTEFYARFTRDVVNMAQDEETGTEGRIVSVLEGGYSDRALCSGVLSHLSGLCDDQTTGYSQQRTPNTGLGYEMSQRMGKMRLQEEDVPMPSTEPNYDPSWWQEGNLEWLEGLVAPPPPIPPKKPRTSVPPTYYSPTASFSAKVVDPTKVHRNVSGSIKFTSVSPSRAPTPPPPEVEWPIAAHELSKLLIPANRQTKSCTAEDLSEPQVKRERHSIAPATLTVEPVASGRQLRGRKPKAPTYAEPSSDVDSSSLAAATATKKSDRRQTMADFTPARAQTVAPRVTSRRLSVASSIGSVNGDGTASRASSVVASRKSSVTPAPSSNGVTVRKARAPSQVPSETARSRTMKTEPPVPRVPSGYLKAPEKENDIDQITSGLQRVKLRMPTKEQHDAKEKQERSERSKARNEALAARLKAAVDAKSPLRKPAIVRTKSSTSVKSTTTTRKPVVKNAEASVTPPETVAPPVLPQPAILPQDVPSIPAVSRSISDPIQPPTVLMDLDIEPGQLPKNNFTTVAEPISLATSPPRPDTPPPPPPPSLPQFNEFIAYTHPSQQHTDALKTASTHAQPQQLQWQPPNSDIALPSPVTRADVKKMPVFTARGKIPFAQNPKQESTARRTSNSHPYMHLEGQENTGATNAFQSHIGGQAPIKQDSVHSTQPKDEEIAEDEWEIFEVPHT
ncbi:Arginase/deacetylase [Lophium mytilinum]|uniref:Arginase/deacetylase n=1 Tax=Lophium mytilinum TaxID=390894 RepID=A0A6A6Q9K8_9PEZI|nr:Arginase/deacetylase [Lophium mytilinum]